MRLYYFISDPEPEPYRGTKAWGVPWYDDFGTPVRDGCAKNRQYVWKRHQPANGGVVIPTCDGSNYIYSGPSVVFGSLGFSCELPPTQGRAVGNDWVVDFPENTCFPGVTSVVIHFPDITTIAPGDPVNGVLFTDPSSPDITSEWVGDVNHMTWDCVIPLDPSEMHGFTQVDLHMEATRCLMAP